MHVIRFASLITLIAVSAFLAACETTEPGVRSSGFEQFATIDRGTAEATRAAEEVLRDLGLQDVASSSTNVDGWATGKMADGTQVKVTLKRDFDNISGISVRVGSIGDTSLGKDIISRVRSKLGIASPPPPPPAAPEHADSAPAVEEVK
jgi:hypothetical protein